LQKPDPIHAKELSRLFPSTSATPQQPVGVAFDPQASCVALPQQKKKRVATKIHPKVIKVVLLSEGTFSVPRGRKRKLLMNQGRIQSIHITRIMSALQVKIASSEHSAICL